MKRRLRLTVLLALGAACADPSPTAPGSDPDATAAITVSAQLTASEQAVIKGLSVEVTGPGIASPIVANLDVTGVTVNGTVTVPVGGVRLFTVRAFDASAIEAYRGSATANVRPGVNAALAVRLDPLTGGTPITVSVSTYSLVITPSALSLPVGVTRALTATVTNADGSTVSAPAIQWGSSNPVIASVAPDASGGATVAGGVAGITSVVASYLGVVASATADVTPGVTALAVGSSSSCALFPSGRAYCWGFNGNGAVGDGTTSNRSSPVAVSGGLAFTALAVGVSNACGLTSGGAAYCWGRNTEGQLGDGTTTDRIVPTRVALDGVALTRIAPGARHTCALSAAGTAYCWGANEAGQLGVPASVGSVTTPTAVAGGLAFAAISTGGRTFPADARFPGEGAHTCALTVSGAAYCWGNNDTGQLGDATRVANSSPTPVAGNIDFARLHTALGRPLTCGVTRGGALYCWGASGGASDPDASSAATPVALSSGIAYASVASGSMESCALDAAGAARCWLGGAQDFSPTAALLAAPVAFAAVGVGGGFRCGLTASGAVYCAGSNGGGQLGDGTTVSRDAFAPVQFP